MIYLFNFVGPEVLVLLSILLLVAIPGLIIYRLIKKGQREKS